MSKIFDEENRLERDKEVCVSKSMYYCEVV